MTKDEGSSVWLWAGGALLISTALAVVATRRGRGAVRKGYNEVKTARELLRELPEARRRAQVRVVEGQQKKRRAKARKQIDRLRQQIAALEAT